MVTLKQAKDYIDLQCTEYDGYVTELLEYSIGIVHNIIGSSLELQSHTDIRQGSGRQFLSLSKPAIKTISEVLIDGLVKDSSTYSLSRGFLFSNDIWERCFIYDDFGHRLVSSNIVVTYDFGYTYPLITNSVNGGDVPKELQYAVLEICKRMFILSGTQQQIQTKSGLQVDAQFSKSYFKLDIKELVSKDVDRIIKKYI